MLRTVAILGLFLLPWGIACRVPGPRDIEGRVVGVARTAAGRVYVLNTPPAATLGKPMPLIVLLHGYGSSGQGQSTYFGLDAQVAKRGFLLAKPDGTHDTDGSEKRYWSAFPPAAAPSPVDDVAFLMALVNDVGAAYSVDPDRVYLMGHSNGAFMAYRMACDHAETFAAVVALAGAVEPSRCHPSHPVSVAVVHGTEDQIIKVEGGQAGANLHYGSLAQTVAVWMKADHCGGPLRSVGRDDLVSNAFFRLSAIWGAETDIERASGCEDGSDVELWMIEGAGTFRSGTRAAGRPRRWIFYWPTGAPRRPDAPRGTDLP
jgi:polyhydroxybutyrate depolymerase